MEKTILTLKSDAKPVTQHGQFGLIRDGQTHLTEDLGQIALLQALLAGPQPLDSLTALLHKSRKPSPNEAEAALLLAAFILEFEPYLES